MKNKINIILILTLLLASPFLAQDDQHSTEIESFNPDSSVSKIDIDQSNLYHTISEVKK